MTEFVIDCSVTMSWCFPDEATEQSSAILDTLQNGRAVAAALWPLEVRNVLIINERRARITAAESDLFLERLDRMPIVVEREVTNAMVADILALSRASSGSPLTTQPIWNWLVALHCLCAHLTANCRQQRLRWACLY